MEICDEYTSINMFVDTIGLFFLTNRVFNYNFRIHGNNYETDLLYISGILFF